MPHHRRMVIVALQGLILGLFLWHVSVVRYVADDGFISFQYARHLAQGDGLVYNIGERVEGYTDFLWVVLLAGIDRLLPSFNLPQVAMVAGTLASVAVIILAFRLSGLLSRGPEVGLLAGAFLAAHSGLVAWSTAGLEATLFALLVFAAGVSYVSYLQTGKRAFGVPILFALAALTRPDGILFFGLTLAATAIIELGRKGMRGLAVLAQFLAAFAAIYVPYFIWRYTYYGDLFPNTAYAKVGLGVWQLNRGGRYLWDYSVQYGVFLWIVPVVLLLWRSREPWLWYFVGLIAAYLSYVIYVGGDGLGFHRFVVHVAPFIYFVAAAALVDFYGRYVAPRATRGVRLAGAAVAIVVLLAITSRATLVPILAPNRARWFEAQSGLWFPGDGKDHSYFWFDNYFVDRLAVAARYLEQNAPPNSVVAATPAGSIAYHMHHPVIDMLGLNDRHIARTQDVFQGGWRYGRAGHEKGDGKYVLSRSPDYILMGNVAVLPYPLTEESMADKLVLKSEHEIWDDPAFHRRYELVSIHLSDRGLFRYFTFFRKKP